MLESVARATFKTMIEIGKMGREDGGGSIRNSLESTGTMRLLNSYRSMACHTGMLYRLGEEVPGEITARLLAKAYAT